MKKKIFYACADILLPSPQPEQGLVINKKAEMENGVIKDRIAEEFRTAENQYLLLDILKGKPGFDGIIFFTVYQFLYGKHFNLKLFNDIQNQNYEIHFARENFSFYKNSKNNQILDFIISHDLVFRRKEEEIRNLIY
tara:strand:- start:383 stop:793 length:411 start_codon:yes stop_codon:yes gene_type:complete